MPKEKAGNALINITMSNYRQLIFLVSFRLGCDDDWNGIPGITIGGFDPDHRDNHEYRRGTQHRIVPAGGLRPHL